MPPDAFELPGDAFRRENRIHRAGGDRRARHVGKPRRLVLRERDSAFGLDRFEPQGAVGERARQDDADRTHLVRLGERLEEIVDRKLAAARLGAGHEPEPSVGKADLHVRGDDVHVVRPDPHSALHLEHLHPRRPGHDFREHARVGRVEVLNEDERHPGVGGEAREKLRERLDASGRSADPDDGEALIRGRLGGRAIGNRSTCPRNGRLPVRARGPRPACGRPLRSLRLAALHRPAFRSNICASLRRNYNSVGLIENIVRRGRGLAPRLEQWRTGT